MSAIQDRIAEHRVDLTKRPATYYVVADDESVYDDDFYYRPDAWTVKRIVLEVQRAAEDEGEQEQQWDSLAEICLVSQSPLRLLACTAVSHAHAASLARREFAERQAFTDLTDVADEVAFEGAGFSPSSR